MYICIYKVHLFKQKLHKDSNNYSFRQSKVLIFCKDYCLHQMRVVTREILKNVLLQNLKKFYTMHSSCTTGISHKSTYLAVLRNHFTILTVNCRL